MNEPDPPPEHLDPTILRPEPLDPATKMRLRATASRAARVYPGPVGELISREVMCWVEFGYRLGGSALVARVADDVLKKAATTRLVSDLPGQDQV